MSHFNVGLKQQLIFILPCTSVPFINCDLLFWMLQVDELFLIQL